MGGADAADTDGATTSRRPTKQSTPRAAHQWRIWFVIVPALIGIVLCAAGALLVTPTSDGGFPAYLCVIIGGWAVGFALVNALSAWPERWQWGGHVALALGAIALLASTTPLIRTLGSLPEPWPRSLSVVALGIPPAGGWVLITLLGRISGRFDRAAERRAAALAEPTWSGADRHPEVTVNAARFTTAALTALAVGAVVVVGALSAVVVIVTERWLLRLPPLMIVVALGLFVGMPVYAAIWGVVNSRRLPVTLRWHTGALVVDAEDRWTVPYPMIQSVIWRSQGDTARFEVHTATRSETFLVGMVRQQNGKASQLPPLMHRMRRVLEEAGLRPHERRGTLRYTRSAPTNTVSGSGAPPPALG